jgi:predicted dehydrogenase
LGWIGRSRLQELQARGLGEVAALADARQPVLQELSAEHPQAETCPNLDALLEHELDGVVIATPSGQHAEQCLACLRKGLAVFCQKPLARTGQECGEVVSAAHSADRLLGIDFSYRHVNGVSEMRRLVQSGALGRVFLADLVFHNAYGPDKAWFFDPRQSGGGCVIDLGIHLVDIAQWILGKSECSGLESRLWRDGELLRPGSADVENAAVASWRANETEVRLACSWHLSAGQDCVIEASFYGSRSAVQLRNRNGSFYDFEVDHCVGVERRVVGEDSGDWKGGAVSHWASRLSQSRQFDPAIEDVLSVARLIDEVYGR